MIYFWNNELYALMSLKTFNTTLMFIRIYVLRSTEIFFTRYFYFINFEDPLSVCLQYLCRILAQNTANGGTSVCFFFGIVTKICIRYCLSYELLTIQNRTAEQTYENTKTVRANNSKTAGMLRFLQMDKKHFACTYNENKLVDCHASVDRRRMTVVAITLFSPV